MSSLNKRVAEAFLEVASALETGEFKNKVRIGLTLLGSELGSDELLRAAEMASQDGNFDVVVIGPKFETELETFETDCESTMHEIMEDLLEKDYIQGCVTLHYSFPIGVSTVGRVITPATGREMLIATTTGTSATQRTEAMFKNALYGISTAKALGIKKPTVGILNVDNARGVERALKELQSNGFDLTFGESKRSDKGHIMRGNDLLMGSVDVMVTDSLTGNILMKMFSSNATGGSYEATGFGYGPGVGFDFKKNILIISRASGAPVIANAIRYAAQLAKGNLQEVIAEDYKAAKKAGYETIIEGFNKAKAVKTEVAVEVEKEIVTAEISGIDILDLEDAVSTLKQKGIYAESGMGCTGPIVMINEKRVEASREVLKEAGYIG
jgi:hypothetical protein